MGVYDQDRRIDLTKVPLAFATGGVLKKGVMWNSQEIIAAGTEIAREIISEYADIALYVPTSLRIKNSTSELEKMVRANIAAHVERQKAEKLQDISQSYDAGEVVFEQGDTENQDCFFLVDGSVDVVIGGRCIVAIDEPGCPIGEMSFLSDEPRTATIRASEGGARLLLVRRRDQHKLLRSNPTIVKTLMDALVGRLADTSSQLSKDKSSVESACGEIVVLEEKIACLTQDNARYSTALTDLGRRMVRGAELHLGDLNLIRALRNHTLEQIEAEPANAGPEVIRLLDAFLKYAQQRETPSRAQPTVDKDLLPPELAGLTTDD